MSACNEKHWIKPELIEQTELMQVKLVLHILNESVTQGVPQTIIELIYNNPNITREDIAKQIGVSTKTIGRYLKKLGDKVRFVGSGYSGHWEIIQK
ncbi:MAG: winged helix-turn-helix transcriptional regulator [Paludibacteraceae bacterium]|nr:winged helix-turn-helix transcriptional regulator [Paludibacteraceae bacterium]